MVEHLSNFLGDKGDRPLENVEEIGKQVGVHLVVELLDIELVILSRIKLYFELYYCCFVLVDVAIVRCGKDRYDDREVPRTIPFVHFKSLCLGLMRSNHTQALRLLKKGFDRVVPKKIGASPDIVILVGRLGMPIIIVNGIRPHQIA
jgi:hypothetical protein